MLVNNKWHASTCTVHLEYRPKGKNTCALTAILTPFLLVRMESEVWGSWERGGGGGRRKIAVFFGHRAAYDRKVLSLFFFPRFTDSSCKSWKLLWETVTFCVPSSTSPNCLHLPQYLLPSEYAYCKNSWVDAPKALTLMSLLHFEHYLKCESLRRGLQHKCFPSPERYVQYVLASMVSLHMLQNG